MHPVRHLILAGFQPPECFTPATAEIAQEMSLALATVEYHSVADWRAFIRIQRDFATREIAPADRERGVLWGEYAADVHSLRAFG
jgi:hypothetical protein